MTLKSLIGLYLLFFVATGAICYFGASLAKNARDLQSHGTPKTAIVKKISLGKGGGSYYAYSVAGNDFEGKTGDSSLTVGDAVQIVYLPENPSVSKKSATPIHGVDTKS